MKAFGRMAAMCAIGLGGGVAFGDVFSNYEDLSEGFKGASFTHNGVTYRDVNNVSGFYPDGEPFGPADNGNQVIIERAVPLYGDFPTYGSPFNAMTFGSSFVTGDNLSIGALASVWMNLPELSNSVSFDLAFYENGPWGGVEWRLEALLNGSVVGSTNYVIAGDDPGRDNPTFTTLSLGGVEFDQLHLYGWLNNAYTAPRGIMDNLSVTAVPEPSALLLLGGGMLATLRRRRPTEAV